MQHGRAAVLEFELGGSRDGEVQAYRLRVVQDAGAYPGLGAILPGFTALMSSGVYAIPKIESDTVSVVTNTTPTGPFRGAGRPEATQPIERAMDLFAAEIGIDPAEVRRRNLFRAGRIPAARPRTGAGYDSGDYGRALDLALETAGYEALREEQQRRRESGDTRALGIGVSVYVEITNGLVEPELGDVEITPEGEAVLRTGSFSHGQGHETTFAMIVADRLGLPVEAVRVIKGDTDEVSQGTGTYGSKSTQIGGAAARQAAEVVVERARVARLRAARGERRRRRARRRAGRLPRRRLADAGARRGRSSPRQRPRREGSRSCVPPRSSRPSAPTFPFGAHVAAVEVDTETGEVELRRLVAVDDAGTIVNPLIAEGQVHGGVAAGRRAGALRGVRVRRGGQPARGIVPRVRVPSAAELPSWDVVGMETPTPLNALGAKGIGESGTIGSTPAVQSAVVDALAPSASGTSRCRRTASASGERCRPREPRHASSRLAPAPGTVSVPDGGTVS